MKHKRFLTFFFLTAASVSFFTAGIGLAALSVTIQEWDLPTPNSRPHDPAVAPDGSLWYTGMRSNTLGRVDPKTGRIREFALKTPGSGPHGLVADKEGNIWFTANYKGYIGKLDPRTGKVIEYPMPDPAARIHTLRFSTRRAFYGLPLKKATSWAGWILRTGIITLKKSPTPNSLPYGIAVNSKGIPFFLRVRDQQARQYQSEHDGDHRIPAP